VTPTPEQFAAEMSNRNRPLVKAAALDQAPDASRTQR
jgi:hypothetical protein